MALASSTAPKIPEPALPGALLDVNVGRSPSLSASVTGRSLSPSASGLSYSASSASRAYKSPSRIAMASETPEAQALLAAAQNKDEPKVAALLEAGVPANVRGQDTRTPLMHSCRLQDAATAKTLLAHGADPNLRNGFGYSPLGTASTLGAIPIIELLINNKPPADLESRTAEGMTPLLLAAQGGHVEAVKILVKAGADVEARGRDGRGAVHWFARQGLKDGIEWLIKEGKADTELRNRDGYTPLNTAAALGDLDMVKTLVALGAKTETRTNAGHTPLLSALLLLPVRSTNIDTVKYLIQDAKVNVNAEGEDGRTALHHAARMGELTVAKLLVDAGATVDKKNVGGFTALNTASFYGQDEVVAYLLDKGANPNMASLEGWTALHSASHRGNVECAKLLINNDAEVEAFTDEGWTPLMIAAHQNRPEMVQELLRRGASTTIKSSDGATAVDFAAASSSEAVKELLGAPDEYRVEGIAIITEQYRYTRDEYRQFKSDIESKRNQPAAPAAAADEVPVDGADEMAAMEKSDDAGVAGIVAGAALVEEIEVSPVSETVAADTAADDEDIVVDTSIPADADLSALLVAERTKAADLARENRKLKKMLAASDAALAHAVAEANAALQSQADLANKKLRESAKKAEAELAVKLEDAKARFAEQLKAANDKISGLEGRVGGSVSGMVESPTPSIKDLTEAS